MSRNIRTFSTLGRSLFRTPKSAPQNGPVYVQHVRIVKPFFTSLRIKKMTMTLVMAGLIWHRLGQLDDDEDEKKEETRAEQLKEAVHQVKVSSGAEKLGPDGAGAEQVDGTEAQALEESADDFNEDELVPEEQPEDAWFIPLGLAKEVPRTFYKGTDPEWQSFVEFARDRKRGLAIRNELAGIVGAHVANISNFQMFLGAPVTTGKYWLDVDFPDGPPPEYERAGIEIADDYVAYTIRPVDAINVSRLRQALWPLATGSSIWTSCRTFLRLQTAKVRKALNMEEAPNTPTGKRILFGYTDLSQLMDPQPGTPSPHSTTNNTEVKPPKMVSATPASDNDNLESGRPWILRPLPAVPKPNTELSKATTAFKHSLAQNWKSASAPPPRGTFLVSGLVEVFGPKGICTLDVRAAYNPVESQWVVVSIGLRRMQRRKQRARGG